MKKLGLMIPPILAAVIVISWKCFVTGEARAFNGEPARVDEPPTAECEATLERTLQAIQEGLTAVESLSNDLATARHSLPGDEASHDVDWQAINRTPSFVAAFVDHPPGLPARALHRCSDLNPDDVFIPADLREGIEAAVQPYYAALLEARNRGQSALAVDLAEAERRGLANSTPLQLEAGKAMSIMLPDSGEPVVSQMQALPDGSARTLTVARQHMPTFNYYESLEWYVAREAGVQIVSIYASLGFVPSNSAEVMTRRIVERCERHIP